jgi:hypothetical protein
VQQTSKAAVIQSPNILSRRSAEPFTGSAHGRIRSPVLGACRIAAALMLLLATSRVDPSSRK